MKGLRTKDRICFILLLLGTILPDNLHAQTDEYLKSYITTKGGLSQNEVTTIGEDKYGFIWFGTRGGLNRYDGYNFKTFKSSHLPGTSLNNPSIECLFFDHDGKFWIGSKSGGISIYDPVTEAFSDGNSLVDNLMNRVTAVFQDMDGVYWIGGFYEGLMSYDPATSETIVWMEGTIVQSIVQTPDSTIWVGTQNSLSYKRPGEEFRNFNPGIRPFTITEIVVDPDQPFLWFSGWNLPLVKLNYENFNYEIFELPESMFRIYSLFDDKQGKIWVGTWGTGLFYLDKSGGKFHKVEIYPDSRFSLITDYDIILDIYCDSQGLIWVGTDGGGVVMLAPSNGFKTVNSFFRGQKYHITSILETETGNVVFGTRGQGLFVARDSLNTSRLTFVGDDEKGPGRNVYYLGQENEGFVWVGLERGLFVLLENSTGDLELLPAATYFNSPVFNTGLAKVLGVQKRGDELWVATQQYGLFLYNWNGKQYQLVRVFSAGEDTGGLNSNRVTSLELDEEGQLWAGTYDGLFLYRSADSIFVPVEDLLSNSLKPLCNIILCTHFGSNNLLWFGTPCSLNKLERDGENSYLLKEYTINDGMPDDYVSNILEDSEGNIWFSNNKGISKLEVSSGSIFNFESGEGTGDSNFSESAGFISPEGVIYFGSFSGYIFFKPEELRLNRTIPPIAISGVKVMNREVKISPDGLLPVSVNEVEKLVLGHKDREISFEIAALDYKSPGNNQYQYKLERKGTSSSWEYIGNRRIVSFQNLEPGEYTLYLKGSNSNGIWSENSRKLNIKVLTSPLKRWYAILVYTLIILMIILLIIQTSLKQERLRNETKMANFQREQEKQINEYKLRFFTNISHELRTPLSMILAPLNELIRNNGNELPRNATRKLGMIKNNADRLLKLFSQLIEFRKVEAGKVKLEAAEQDLVLFMKEIIQPFSELADQRGMQFKTDFKVKKVAVFFDSRKMSVVINNLLNNAIKYSGEPGYVFVQLFESESEVFVSFRNDGKGIRPGDIEHIFDRFYQVSSSSYLDSSGIGLALVKNYIDMHRGSIFVKSTPNESTTFEVRLKKGRDHLYEEEICDSAEQAIITEEFLLEREEGLSSGVFRHMGTRGAKIAVIDDSKDVRDYLKDILSPYYEVTTAENGKIGFDRILEVSPDLILSDVMMPEMDGYELCEKVKSHEKLSQIPFVMLTAKGTASDMIFGARKGADYYLTKPFDSELILEKVRQILSSRKKLISQYSRKVLLDPVSKEITSEDERIIKAAIKIIEDNIENENLNLELMADKMAMSSSTLYRKMKALSGQSPGEFIRSVRFKRAAQLLRDSDLAVSEIIEQIGYHSAKQFRENFKSEFGASPVNYRKQFRDGI